MKNIVKTGMLAGLDSAGASASSMRSATIKLNGKWEGGSFAQPLTKIFRPFQARSWTEGHVQGQGHMLLLYIRQVQMVRSDFFYLNELVTTNCNFVGHTDRAAQFARRNIFLSDSLILGLF